MRDSELERLIESKKELFEIINFCDKAVLTFGAVYFYKDYGLNSFRNNEIKRRLSDYHRFSMDLDHGFSGAYNEWDKLTLSYEGHTVLDVEYFGSGSGTSGECKVNFSDKNGEWHAVMHNLLKRKGLIERDKKVYERKRAHEDALEQKCAMLEKKDDSERKRAEELRKSLNDFAQV